MRKRAPTSPLEVRLAHADDALLAGPRGVVNQSGVAEAGGLEPMGMLTGFLLMGMVPAYFILQPLALVRLSGRWRIAAAAPLILAIPAAGWCLLAFVHESNLWPLAFIFFAPIGTLYLATVLILALVL